MGKHRFPISSQNLKDSSWVETPGVFSKEKKVSKEGDVDKFGHETLFFPEKVQL